MDKRNNRKPEPWRIVAGMISIVYILYMWVEKDITAVYTTMPQEQVAPLVVTTVAVSLIKFVAIAGGLFLIKWIIGKVKRK